MQGLTLAAINQTDVKMNKVYGPRNIGQGQRVKVHA